MSVGQHIRSLRKAKSWGQTELAKQLTNAHPEGKTVSRVSVTRWESGKDHPREGSIRALAKVFDRPEWEFERFGVRSTGQPSTPHRRTIPLLSWAELKHVVAGGMVPNLALTKPQQLEVDDKTPEHAFGIIINDDSMGARFMPGDEVIIDPKLEPVFDADDPDFVLVRLTTGQEVFREYRLRAPGAYDLVAYHKDCKTVSVTPGEPAELLGTMIEHRRKRRRR